MKFNEYQELAHKTAVYPEERAFNYVIMGLVSEVGELTGYIKKWIRGDYADAEPDLPDILEYELGDILWYLAELCTVMNISLEDIAKSNIEKLSDRAARGVIRGSGDKR